MHRKCSDALVTHFRNNSAKSEVFSIKWALRRIAAVVDATTDMVTTESMHKYAAQHTFQDLEDELTRVNATRPQHVQKKKSTFPYKTSSGRAAFQTFLLSIGCVWSDGVHPGGALVTRPQRVRYRGRMLMYDHATQKVYAGEFAAPDSPRFEPYECVGTWIVPLSVRSQWAKDDIIAMTDDVGAWEDVYGARL